MNRPWLIWIVLGSCALLIAGAMAWSTRKAIQLEGQQALAESSVQLEERIRLSLSRMDTAASGLLILENQRPLHHYEAFFEPEDLLTNQFQVVGKGVVYQSSPLLPEVPEFVRLHFEIDAMTREVTSPQVPLANERDYAEQSGIRKSYLDENKAELVTLRRFLDRPGPVDLGQGGTQLDLMCRVCSQVNEAYGNRKVAWNIPDPIKIEQKAIQIAEALEAKGTGLADKGAGFQEDRALVEKKRRADLYQENSQRAVPKAQGFRPFKKGEAGSFRSPRESKNVKDDRSKVEAEERVEGSTGGAGLKTGQRVAVPGIRAGAIQEEQPRPSGRLVEPPSAVTPFQPIWLGGELFIVREVSLAEGFRYQGAWLKADALADKLLGYVMEDLLPFASLEPIGGISTAAQSGILEMKLNELSIDPLSLVTFPWRLRPGEEPVAANIGWSALRISLIAGWVALLLALLAAAVLVRGVLKLSERRATFVSSVTHELRTPLTTFHLYSDMLAEGMVKDQGRQTEYLTTMRREAERLNHLVENVLSYSKVERGSARAEHQSISLEALFERMRPRLCERTKKDHAELEVIASEGAGSVNIDTDLTAVEQIVFNLVDNACKYGLPAQGPRAVFLRGSQHGGVVRIEISDNGEGVPRSDRKKLFRPFHKSARDAAHSKPGVGLGLALCRRLARELGGDLRLERGREGVAGACFVLELPSGR